MEFHQTTIMNLDLYLIWWRAELSDASDFYHRVQSSSHRGRLEIARSPSDGQDDPRFSSHRGRLGYARSSSDGHDDPRSSSHLGDTWTTLERPIPIRRAKLFDDVEPSSAIEEDRTAAIKREPRSWLPIAVRSWPYRPTIEANSPLNQVRFVAGLKPRCLPRESLPWPHQSAAIRLDFWAKIPFKSMCFSSYFLNFWSIREVN